MIGGSGLNVSFMVGLAFAVAASANFPALLLALTWRRFNTTGAVTGVLFGVISSIVLVIVSPKVWPGPTPTGSPFGWELANPGIVSIPLGFIGCWLGTVLSTERGAERTSTSSTSARRPGWAPRRRSPALIRGVQIGGGGLRPPPLTHLGEETRHGRSDARGQLEELLEQETFAPPERVRPHAVISDPGIHERGGRATPRASGPSRPRRSTGPRSGTQVLDWSNPPFAKWFAGGKLNVSHNCLDRHVEAGSGDRVAFHWRGEEGEERDVTYADLLRDVQRFANALKDRGIGPGDVVGIYLPMIPEVAVAMLACARIGAPHNVVFGGFSRRVGARSGWSSPRPRR